MARNLSDVLLLASSIHCFSQYSCILSLISFFQFAFVGISCILYGVEVLNHTHTDIKKLERLQVQVQICKQIQGLPERTANLAEHVTQGLIEHISFFFLLVFSHQL
jgi:hypothetical protein